MWKFSCPLAINKSNLFRLLNWFISKKAISHQSLMLCRCFDFFEYCFRINKRRETALHFPSSCCIFCWSFCSCLINSRALEMAKFFPSGSLLHPFWIFSFCLLIHKVIRNFFYHIFYDTLCYKFKKKMNLWNVSVGCVLQLFFVFIGYEHLIRNLNCAVKTIFENHK